jgi:excisionase family DNA binding protein
MAVTTEQSISHRKEGDSVPTLLSVIETAERLNVSEVTIRRLIAAGELAYVRIGGRVLFRPVDLSEFIEKSVERRQPKAKVA